MSRRGALGVLLLVLVTAAPRGWAGPRQIMMTDFVQDLWDAGEDGPPNPGVTTVFQSRDGYLWVGTFAGVARFDGIQFRRPQVSDPAAQAALADHIRCVAEAPDGALWFGTRRYGAIRLKDGQTYQVTPESGLPNGEARAIVVTPAGVVWIATSAGLVSLEADGRLRRYGVAQGLLANDVASIYLDRDGTLLAGTQKYGLARFDGTRFHSTTLVVPNTPVRDQAFGLPFESVGAIARDDQGVLWAGTSAGLVRVPEGGGRPAPPVPMAVNRLVPARDGGLWASTGAGLGRLQGGSWQVRTAREGLANDDLLTVFEDREGSLWIGTRMGLIRLRPRAVSTYTEKDGLGGSGVNCVLETSTGDLWVGHRKGASRLRDGRWTTLDTDDGLVHPAVRALAEAPDGTIWIGTADGLGRYKDGRLVLYQGAARPYVVRGMRIDAQGRVWMATNQGIDRVDGSRVVNAVPKAQLCDTAQPNTFLIDRENALWVASNTALLRFRDGKSECWKDDALTRNDIRTLYEDREGRIWVGSIGGLSRMIDGQLRHVAGDVPLLRDSIYGFLDDGQGSYWVSTPQGISRIDKARIDRATDPNEALSLHRSFGSADGMETPVGTGGGVPTAWVGRNGRLYFANALGVAIVDPARIREETYRAPMFVEALIVDRAAVPTAGVPRLAAGTRDVELQYAMLSFISPERIQYKYRLFGHDQAWITSGNRRSAYYSNLRPGRYRFHVIAANHRGVWNEDGASLEFEVLPHFYERASFRVAAAVALMFAGFAAYSWRVRQLRAHERELEQRVKEAVAQIQTLKGLLPICASCKKIRDDSGYWNQMETYIHEHSGADFSHSICPECMTKLYPEYVAESAKE